MALSPASLCVLQAQTPNHHRGGEAAGYRPRRPTTTGGERLQAGSSRGTAFPLLRRLHRPRLAVAVSCPQAAEIPGRSRVVRGAVRGQGAVRLEYDTLGSPLEASAALDRGPVPG